MRVLLPSPAKREHTVEQIFFAIRLPVFLCGVVLVTLIWIPLYVLKVIAGSVVIPFCFILAAFENKTDVLKKSVKVVFSFPELSRAYRKLFKWLQSGW